jgi:hypothetical protein
VQHTITHLVPHTMYRIRARTYSLSGWSEWGPGTILNPQYVVQKTRFGTNSYGGSVADVTDMHCRGILLIEVLPSSLFQNRIIIVVITLSSFLSFL